jgi:hypothetical protein
MDASVATQILQYESELAELEELIKVSPEDNDSLLSIKSDLEELLSITRQQLIAATTTTTIVLEKSMEAAVGTSIGVMAEDSTTSGAQGGKRTTTAAAADVVLVVPPIVASQTTEPAKKKSKKVKDFEVPSHLVTLDTDSEAQKQRKIREMKKLKNKWRERKKEFETDRKKQSWHSFQKKKGSKDKSMFSTQDGDAKVGVVRGEL